MDEVTHISQWCNTISILQRSIRSFVLLSRVIKFKSYSSRDTNAKFWDALGILGYVIS